MGKVIDIKTRLEIGEDKSLEYWLIQSRASVTTKTGDVYFVYRNDVYLFKKKTYENIHVAKLPSSRAKIELTIVGNFLVLALKEKFFVTSLTYKPENMFEYDIADFDDEE